MEFYQRLKNNPFVRNFSLILSGNLINQIILIITYPLIARLYLPNQIGLFAQLQAIFNITILIGTLKYEQAIIISKNKEEEKLLISLSFYILIIISFLTYISFCIFPTYISNQLKNPVLKNWLYLLPIFTFLGGLQLILNNVATKRKLFNISNYSNISLSSGNSIFKLIFGFANLTSIGLFISRLLSFALAVIMFFIKKIEINIVLPTKENIKKLKKIAVFYKDFPLYLNSSNFVNMISISVLSLLISRYWDVTILGYYSIAVATLNLPITMIRKTFQTVYYQRASEFKYNKTKLYSDYKKIVLILIVALIIPILIVYFWGDKIYIIFLGHNWLQAGKIAGFIFPWLAASLIGTPATVLIPVLNMQKYLLILQTTIFLSRVGILILTYHLTKNYITAFKILSLHGILLNVFHITYIWKKLGKNG